jgi:hypothetical protein
MICNAHASLSIIYITYNEVITAALETGALTLEEVKIAVTYDDL